MLKLLNSGLKMKISFIQKNSAVSIFTFLILILLFTFEPLDLNAKADPNSILDHLDLIINVNNIATHGEISLRGLTANFPYPILSTISVVDSAGNIIIGLADTLRWLKPGEIAENGLLVSDIWKPLMEYHEKNPSIPPDPDIYQQTPEPLITEVRNLALLPSCTMLVMDVSESMVEEIAEAKEGLRSYVRLFRPNDRGGIVQFSSSVVDYQPMTSDTSLLIQKINDATVGGGTAIYDALMKAIEGIKCDLEIRSIIIYTDGEDKSSKVSPQAVIDSARIYNLPIYTIALGEMTQEDVLKLIADQTNGIFFKAATAEEMEIIYGKLSVLMQNYYVMAHASPDPFFNKTWRLVDVTVNLPNLEGTGVGRYFVGGPPTKLNTDLEAKITSITDTAIVIAGDSVNAVKPGKNYEYLLTVNNLGPNLADTVKLIHFLPDSVQFLNASISPDFVTADSLEWKFTGIVPQREFNISVNVQLKNNVPRNLANLVSKVKVFAINDTNTANNFDIDTVKVLFPELAKNYDLSLRQQVFTDTSIDLAGNEVSAVLEGDTYNYLLTIKNSGPNTAYDFTLRDIIADSVTLTNFTITPANQTSDSLFWMLDSLAASDSINVSFEAIVADSLPIYPFPLINVSELIAANDTTAENNSTSSTVYAIKKQKEIIRFTDLAITLNSETDTTIYVNLDSVNAVFPGDSFVYLISVSNLGPNVADTVQIIHLLPDSVNFINTSFQPKFFNNDSLAWEFYNFQPGDQRSIRVNVKLADNVPKQLTELIIQANLFGANDSSLSNNFAIDTVLVLFREPQLLKNYDLSLSQIAITDTNIWYQGDSVKAVLQGDIYSYLLSITNSGPVTAYNITLWDVAPDSVTLSAFNIQPSKQDVDTLFWLFDSLIVDDTINVTFNAEVVDSLPVTPFPLINESGLIAQNDTLSENNFSVTTVYGIQKEKTEQPGATDVALTLISSTDTSIVMLQKTYNAVRPGEKFQYLISVRNNGPNSADTVKLIHLLPDSVKFLETTLPAHIFNQDSLFWRFDNFQSGSEVKISVSVQFSTEVPKAIDELISSAFVIVANDTTLDNNSASDTVKELFPELPLSLNYNLTTSQQVFSDTSINIAGEPVPAVLRGDNYRYHLKVINFGPVTARNFTLWDAIPDSIAISDISLSPIAQTRDSLFWKFDSLAKGDSIIIALDVAVAELLPFTPLPLFNETGLIAEHDTAAADDYSSSFIYAIARPSDPQIFNSDISVCQSVVTDSFAIAANDTLHFARTDETYSYTISVTNVSSVAAKDVQISNILPDSIKASNYQPVPERITDDSLFWFLGILLPEAAVNLHFDATVAHQMPVGKNLLINEVRASASNEDPARLENNNSINSVINLVKSTLDWQPYIEARPQVVKAGDAIAVRVQVTAPIESWDLWVYLANGQIDATYGDTFIASNLLVPEIWTTVDPTYSETKLYTEAESENIIFELRVRDVFSTLKTAKATVTIESDNDLIIDQNVFIPDQDNELPIKFKLSADHQVRLEIFDITGTKITNVAEGQFKAGWNTFAWNGLTDNGEKIGSGFYIITIRSGEYQAWKKLMIVR